ncbi:hypothetical protein AK821_08410 [Pseudomonas sp. RIT-PI-r]|jgi:hypothetical protein|nr:hypothetical protein AK821_08410 [Pseudomonas sp. RIT-PI-r]
MPILDDFRRSAGNDRVGRHILSDQRAGRDNGAGTNLYTFKDHRAVANPDVVANRDISHYRVERQCRSGVLKGM